MKAVSLEEGLVISLHLSCHQEKTNKQKAQICAFAFPK